jgi:hypothetical protein
MTSKKIIFLITPSATGSAVKAMTEEAAEENHILLPKAFEHCGWKVTRTTHEALSLGRHGVEIAGGLAAHHDLIWPVGFGPKNGFLDRSGLLASVESTELITPISTQILHHGKSAWAEHCPETHVSNNPNTLLKLLYSEQGSWVLKPMAGSFGRGVQIINAEQGPLLKKVLAQSPGSYFCLQRFLPEISTGEIRTLVVGGEIIGSYLRKPTNELHANLAQMASTERIQLEGPAAKLVARIQQDLVDKRIGFASIDTVGHWLMEVNIANPGGLGTLNRLYEHDFGPKVVEAVERFLN